MRVALIPIFNRDTSKGHWQVTVQALHCRGYTQKGAKRSSLGTQPELPRAAARSYFPPVTPTVPVWVSLQWHWPRCGTTLSSKSPQSPVVPTRWGRAVTTSL